MVLAFSVLPGLCVCVWAGVEAGGGGWGGGGGAGVKCEEGEVGQESLAPPVG